MDKLVKLSIYCGFSKETDDKAVAAELTSMINSDSINYSPPRTFSDKEIMSLLDDIRKGR